MKILALFIALFCLCSASSQARSADWFDRRMRDLDTAIKIEEIPGKIDALGKFMSIASHGGMDEEQKMVFEKAQAALLAIPGHAKYFQERIERTREMVKEHAKLSTDEQNRLQQDAKLVDLGKYEDMRENAFEVMNMLPSPETVAVLGHFLEDPENRAPRNYMHEDYMPFPPNCAAAYLAISNLGIERPPVQESARRLEGRQFDIADVDAWKQWWSEIKSGKRTYRFKGSPIEYGADGPATKEQIERIALNQRMESDRAARHGKNSGAVDSVSPVEAPPAARKPATVAIIAAALALLAAIGWNFRKKAAG